MALTDLNNTCLCECPCVVYVNYIQFYVELCCLYAVFYVLRSVFYCTVKSVHVCQSLLLYPLLHVLAHFLTRYVYDFAASGHSNVFSSV